MIAQLIRTTAEYKKKIHVCKKSNISDLCQQKLGPNIITNKSYLTIEIK